VCFCECGRECRGVSATVVFIYRLTMTNTCDAPLGLLFCNRNGQCDEDGKLHDVYAGGAEACQKYLQSASTKMENDSC
jgi:hypothetical protein